MQNISMKHTLSVALFLLAYSFVQGQLLDSKWYSENDNNGLIIQNSYPKGGPYPGPTTSHYNHSYLVFFTRVMNKTETSLELALQFAADSVEIPHSPDTYVKLFLPPDTMTLEKEHLFSYGFSEIKAFDQATSFKRTINHNEECLFYVVAFFYQTRAEARDQPRGGNRAELVLKGQELFYCMPPQIDSLHCGQISFK